MSIKRFLTRIVENKTGRKCSRCRHNRAGHCTHPSDGMYMKCWHSITRPGYAGRYERPARKPAAVEATETLGTGLTQAELVQLAKIKETLAEAGETAREGGLLED
jgi:hypothetical protein